MAAIYWKEALSRYSRDLRLLRLESSLLDAPTVYVAKDGTEIQLDKKFAFYRVIESVFRPLGLVSGEKIKKDFISKVFIPECLAFYEKEGSSLVSKNLRKVAELMSKVNGLSVEENLRLLFETREEMEEEEMEEED